MTKTQTYESRQLYVPVETGRLVVYGCECGVLLCIDTFFVVCCHTISQLHELSLPTIYLLP